MSKRMLAMVLCGAMLSIAGLAVADDAVEMAKDIESEYGKAVVHVEAVLTITMDGPLAAMVGGGDQEQKIEVVGTVVDPSGLTVVSNTALDPTSAMGKIEINAGGQQMSMTLKGEVNEVRIRLADGTEIPARVVLKDEDLDLAFIAPTEKLGKKARGAMQSVELDQAAAKAQKLAQTITLGRLGKDMNRELTVGLSRIKAVVTKPRTFYVLGDTQPGTPVFDTKGKLLGISLFRKKPGGAGKAGLGAIMGGGGLGVTGTPITLPTANVKRVAEQAKEEMSKPAAEKKPDDADVGGGMMSGGMTEE